MNFWKTTRQKHNLTLRQVETETGLSNAYLSQLENDKIKNPSFNTIEKLTAFYQNYRVKGGNTCVCPNCRSKNVKDASVTQHNNVFGPGSASWVIFETMVCEDCGIYFKKVKGNGI